MHKSFYAYYSNIVRYLEGRGGVGAGNPLLEDSKCDILVLRGGFQPELNL